MYIDYNYRIKIIALIYYKFKISKRKKQIKVVKFINYVIDMHNNDYLSKKATFPFVINNMPLDYNQKIAIYSDELSNLILAGAGSGKTLTIVGKINYLIEQKNLSPEEIICFAFTNEACNNLKSKLNYNVEVYTFHKFALKFLPSNYGIDNNKLEYIIDEYFNGVILSNTNMIKKVMKCLNKRNYKSYIRCLDSKELYFLKREIKIFINLFKSYGYHYNDFLKIKKHRFRNIILIIIDIYTLYISELLSTNNIDLDMLITLAATKIRNCTLKYKYIIIDEFQDISQIRLDLIMSIINSSGAKLMAVGDDYQSIYGFSGCDSRLLFKLYNSKINTKVVYLKNNYRCCQEIVNISTKFIVKNNNQIKKTLTAIKYISKPIVLIKEGADVLEKLLNYLRGVNNILILGRNNNDIYYYLNKELIGINGKIIMKYTNNIFYKTVHSAKGLEAECVIIINLTNKLTGFPSQIKDSSLISYAFPKENYMYAEERRLFYVALTRSKGKVYLLYSSNTSIFLKEIIKEYKKNITYLNL